MGKIVSNATPLIYLAKIGKLDLLRLTFSGVIIPEQVKVEVVDRGKELKQVDALVVEKAIKEGWIKVSKTTLISTPIELEIGEIAVLSLAKRLKIRQVLVDETPARTAARLLGLQPRGTISVLLSALKRKAVSYEEFLDIMDLLIMQGFRLKQEVYLQAIKEARRFST